MYEHESCPLYESCHTLVSYMRVARSCIAHFFLSLMQISFSRNCLRPSSKIDMNSPEGVKTLVDSFFSILQEVTAQLRHLQQQHEEKICENEQLKEDFRN